MFSWAYLSASIRYFRVTGSVVIFETSEIISDARTGGKSLILLVLLLIALTVIFKKFCGENKEQIN